MQVPSGGRGRRAGEVFSGRLRRPSSAAREVASAQYLDVKGRDLDFALGITVSESTE